MKRYLPDWFIAGLLSMIAIAWIKPGIGMNASPIHLGLITDVGVVLVFFLYGLKLDPTRLKSGMSNWRMHMAFQLTTFVVFPLLILPFYLVFQGTRNEILWLGMFFLAALPSTVTSSVVMISIAGGNITGGIFNASISGIIGIVMTPFWMSFFLTGQSEMVGFSNVLIKLVSQIIIPVIAGLLLHPLFVKWINRNMLYSGVFEKAIILLIIYQSFSQSFTSGIFSTFNLVSLAGLFISVILLFFFILNFTGILSRKLKFSYEDRITMQFAGSKKSLIHGTVFASVLFGTIPGTGVLLLPVMMYHSFQLFYISIKAHKMKNEFSKTVAEKMEEKLQ